MTLVVSYNIACKKDNPAFFENVDMVRLNSPWYTRESFIKVLETVDKPKFVDINIKERTKAKITDHDYIDLLTLVGTYSVEWVGISNVEDTETYDFVKHHLNNDDVKICAKVETERGCSNIGEIINTYDGIMVDTEDLASEIGWSKASVVKDRIYEMCQMRKKTHFRLSGVIFECFNDKKTVYTYGAFDLFHPGHLRLLQNAKSYGHKLIVGVVGDEAIKKLKGNDRPIQPLADRMDIVANLKCVDEVIVQDTYDPITNLESINPDVLVKGDDWDFIPGEKWIEKEGRKLIKPPYNAGWSTSGTIKKIRGE